MTAHRGCCATPENPAGIDVTSRAFRLTLQTAQPDSRVVVDGTTFNRSGRVVLYTDEAGPTRHESVDALLRSLTDRGYVVDFRWLDRPRRWRWLPRRRRP